MMGEFSTSRRQVILAGMLLALGVSSRPSAGLEPDPASATGFRTIDSKQLRQMLQHKDFLLINVHTPYEGEIEQTDAFMAFETAGADLERLAVGKDAKIVLYCRSGRMSEVAATDLAARGYANVAHLAGGLIAWAEAGELVLVK